jgi:hypothetical protein
MSVVHGKMVSETMEGRVQLMKALMELIKTDGFQKGMKDFIWCLNMIIYFLDYLTNKVKELGDQMAAFKAYAENWTRYHL